MKYKLSLIFIAVLVAIPASLFFSCTSFFTSDSGSRGLSARTLNLVNSAVFEVVIEKPVDDQTVYDRELNWENVPFAIRNDSYYSIGTAFAISKTELITAFHVINLGYKSMVFDKYYVRDSQGEVYEIDKITGGSNEKDYLIFTVKDKTFDRFFQFERNYKIGDTVLSIGNALGEGIVVRNGLVLGTVPESDSGRWDLLKSSADGNPGNSGGPLVTPNGRVVAVVIALRDNILYSVPAEVVLEGSRSTLPHRSRFQFGHLILANKLDNIFETSVSIPDTYAGVRSKIREAYISNYDTAMTALFSEAPEYVTGPNNSFLLNGSLSSSFPQVSFVDPNDDNWKLSNLNARSYNLENDGRLMHAGISGTSFYKIKKPNTVSLEQACTDPKFILDLILQNIRTERTLWGNDKYRILSLGEPASTGKFQDALGRTWISAYWIIGFDDKVQIMYILPTADGPVVLSSIQNSALLQDYEWDLKKTCDHIFAAYISTFNNWVEFLTMKDYVPKQFQDLRLRWDVDAQTISFNSEGVSFNINKDVFDWTGDSEIFLAPSWYRNKGIPEFGVRKIILNRDLRGKDYFILYRNILPDSRLGSSVMESWNDLVQRKFPFDGNPTISVRDNNGSVGMIFDAESGTDTLYSLYLSMENPQNEENLNRRFSALKQGISIE
jgi:hypothetical protein